MAALGSVTSNSEGANAEIARGERFAFGENWRQFLSTLSDERIAEAERSVRELMRGETLEGKTLLDIGCGSGLFSLAARRLGARVCSFDFDPKSMGCAQELRRRYFPDDEAWTIRAGSVLDRAFMESLGRFDVVYSWGVLHHTGDMWKAIDNATIPVAKGGRLVIALYNDQGPTSDRWRMVKRTYNQGPVGKALVTATFVTYWTVRGVAVDMVRVKNPLSRYREYAKKRGMSLVHDWIDWIGGYPFEVAKPEEVLDFLRPRGFELIKLRSAGGTLGNNEFVFERRPGAPSSPRDVGPRG
jgi:2-polyprenyl-3-methyl-5-hydroxy-6-metoxy-1,4-benzoquinol methylase